MAQTVDSVVFSSRQLVTAGQLAVSSRAGLRYLAALFQPSKAAPFPLPLPFPKSPTPPPLPTTPSPFFPLLFPPPLPSPSPR